MKNIRVLKSARDRFSSLRRIISRRIADYRWIVRKAIARQRRQVDHLKKIPTVIRLRQILNSRRFAVGYAVSAVLILLASTFFWALLGARVQLNNADQLVNAMLFEKPETFREALIPGSHSFLLKWPLFMLVKHFGATTNTYIAITVGLVLLTVALLAVVFYRIDRRPLVFGTACLASGSLLMLVPPESAPGALLPVNMAMLATRNIEYLVYIFSLMLLMRTKRIRSVSFVAGVALLAILIASDKLFLPLSVGGAVLALGAYGLSNGWNMVSTAARWIVGGIVAAITSLGIVAMVNARSLVHIASQSGAGPYALTTDLYGLIIGSIYGGLHVFTNFGANPASQISVLREVPHTTLHGLLSLSAPAYLVNFLLFAFCVFAAFKMLRQSLAHNKDKTIWLDGHSKLAVSLLWSSVAAFGVFVATNHYYAGDARYLSIVFFGLLITGAVYASRRDWKQEVLVAVGFICALSTLLGMPAAAQMADDSLTAFQPWQTRNQMIAAAMHQHPVDTLIGDYWRVIPIKAIGAGTLKVTPLASCTTPRDTLSSKAWQPDLNTHSFAYLLTLDDNQTDYPQCSLDEIIRQYGRPNASVVIAGKQARPDELVLFYDKGVRHSEPAIQLPTPSTVLPVAISELPHTTCRVPTVMQIMAHEDDDLLFMNPDLSDELKAGHCVRSVYLTAGDAGAGSFYWLSRQQGSQAAYSKMLGFDDIWVQRIVRISGDQYITVANPRGNEKVSLIFMHLPDGNLKGQGFGQTNFESLAALDQGTRKVLHDVYDGSTYTSDQLVSALTELMQTYQPTEIRTQSDLGGGRYPDHSDHMSAGHFATKAYDRYEAERFAGRVQIPIKYYLGYPIHERAANVSGTQLQEKESVFTTYGQFDGRVCHTIIKCRNDQAYGAYLPRQYIAPR